MNKATAGRNVVKHLWSVLCCLASSRSLLLLLYLLLLLLSQVSAFPADLGNNKLLHLLTLCTDSTAAVLSQLPAVTAFSTPASDDTISITVLLPLLLLSLSLLPHGVVFIPPQCVCVCVYTVSITAVTQRDYLREDANG